MEGPCSKGLMVDREAAEDLKCMLTSLELLDGSKKVIREGEKVIFPVKEGADVRRELSFKGAELVTRRFQPRSKKPRCIKEALEDLLDPHELELIGSSYDIIGGIAVIELPSELSGIKSDIGDVLLRWLPVRTIAVKRSPTLGRKRVKELEVIAGKRDLSTVHKENGLEFSVDLSNVFFNPRLSTERERVRNLCNDEDIIIDMFAGVGPFSITIAARSEKEPRVFAIDINPHAMKHLIRNIRMNGTSGVTAILGDAGKEAPRIAYLQGKADRVIMNLPKSSNTYLVPALESLKPGGTVHYYRLLENDNPLETIRTELNHKWDLEIKDLRKVESYSPSKSIFVADATLRDES